MADVDGNWTQDIVHQESQMDFCNSQAGTLNAFQLSGGPLPTVTPTTPTASPLTPNASVSFTVADISELKGVCVVASYDGSNTRELVWDSTHGFNGYYLGAINTQIATSSSGKVVSRAFRILRDGGWPANITITVFAYDDRGQAAGGF